MFSRLFSLALALVIGVAAGTFVPQVSGPVRGSVEALTAKVPWIASNMPWIAALASQGAAVAPKADDGHGHGAGGHGEGEEKEEEAGAIKMSAQQIESSKIALAPAEGGTIARRVSLPGSVTTDADRVARVPAKVAGNIAELRKRLGDMVAAGDVIAVIESREIADAKSEYRGAVLGYELQLSLVERERRLVESSISTQKQFLTARTAAEEARIKVDVARQKLAALGVAEREIEALPKASAESLRRYEVRSSIAGRIIERKVDLGAPVGQDTELFVVADLSRVWVEVAVPPSDLAAIKEGQAVSVTANGAGEQRGEGRVIFSSPLLDKETRSARIVAEIDNASGAWRPGSFVTADITIEESKVDLVVPRTALQTIGTEQVVFVRNGEGFEKRDVALGKGDDRAVEIAFGVDPGETVAVANTFLLKAELGKASAEHGHAH